MKIKTLVASVVLGMASMSAIAAPNHLFGLSPFGAHPGMGGKPPMERPAKDAKAGGQQDQAARAADEKAAAESRAKWAEQDMERRIERTVRAIDGTPEQAQKIGAIVKSAFADLRPLHEQLFKLDQRATELFKAETIDATAFGELRTERLKLMDSISARSQAAYLEIAALLTPAQRQKLAERPMHPRHGKEMRGERGGERGERGDRDGGKHHERGARDDSPRRDQSGSQS